MSGPPPTATGCAVTVVEAHGGAILAKRWNADGTATPYDNARTVTLHPQPVADLAALADLLRELAPVPRYCIVRGEPIDHARVVRVRRLLLPCPVTGDAPTLREVPRRWVAIDVDSVPVPEGTDLHDLAACARAVLPRLPYELRGVAAIVQATAGHGIKPGVRLRLWYWLSRPTTGAELLEWFRYAPVDPATFRTVQPNYTAAPLFPGRADPLPARLAMLPGTGAVVPVPAPALLRPAPVAPPHPRRDATGSNAGRFDALTRTVRNAAEGTRHRALFWAACRAGEMVAKGSIGAEAAAANLARAAIEGGGRDLKNAEATARDGIVRGKGGAA
jgi:hypothetical protein